MKGVIAFAAASGFFCSAALGGEPPAANAEPPRATSEPPVVAATPAAGQPSGSSATTGYPPAITIVPSREGQFDQQARVPYRLAPSTDGLGVVEALQHANVTRVAPMPNLISEYESSKRLTQGGLPVITPKLPYWSERQHWRPLATAGGLTFYIIPVTD